MGVGWVFGPLCTHSLGHLCFIRTREAGTSSHAKQRSGSGACDLGMNLRTRPLQYAVTNYIIFFTDGNPVKTVNTFEAKVRMVITD